MKSKGIVLMMLFSAVLSAQTVTQAEYFWDTDPGLGNGTPLLAVDGNFNQAIESVFTTNATLPPVGNHIIGIRIKGSDGNWGTVYKRVFKVAANNNTNNQIKITQAEYFWNNDPGEGNGTAMAAFDGNFNQAIESLLASNASFPDLGMNVLHVRSKADDGNWGPVYSKIIGVNLTYNQNLTLIAPSNGATNVPLNSTFSWNIVSGINGYEYQCATDSNFSNIVQAGILAATSSPFTSLNPNTLYYWRVRINLNNEVSLWSSVWSFTSDNALNTNENQINNTVAIYPNPATTTITITYGNLPEIIRYKIFAINGKTITHGQIMANNSIDVQTLPTGKYILSCTLSDGRKTTLQFLKK